MTDDSQPETTTERWIYAGRRTGKGSKQIAAWIDPDGNELWYGAKHAGSSVGAHYQAKVIRHEGAGITLYGEPTFIQARDPEDTRCAEWAAEDKAARTRAARATAERNAAKQDALDEALAPLLTIAGKLRTGADRDALAAYVLRAINSAWAR